MEFMISAHLNGQIFADLGICPYCFMGEESTFSASRPPPGWYPQTSRKESYSLIINPFQSKSNM